MSGLSMANIWYCWKNGGWRTCRGEFSQALSGKSEAPMAVYAMRSNVALVDWGVSDSSSWLRRA